MEEDNKKKIVYKIVIIGDACTGKSSVLVRWSDHTFSEKYIATIGVDFRIVYDPIRDIKLQIWDTAGQQRFRAITSSYYRNADITIILYDITNRDSFNHINAWYTESRHVPSERFSNTGTLIVGSKSDLHHDRRVSTDEAEDFAKSINVMHMEFSARDDPPELFMSKVLELVDKLSLNFDMHNHI